MIRLFPITRQVLAVLAVFSIMADNLRLTGSLANIIVAERVHGQAARATFGDFATIDIPHTALSVTLASCWFYAMGYLPVWYLEHKLHGNRQEAQV